MYARTVANKTSVHIRDLSHYLKDHNPPQKLHIYYRHCSSPITSEGTIRAPPPAIPQTDPSSEADPSLQQAPSPTYSRYGNIQAGSVPHSPTLCAWGGTRGTWVEACLMVLMLDSRRRGGAAALRMGVAAGYAAVEMECD